ncbi:hypothetical protein [uncultured Imperialibacter sp.]|uniref:hypothetical protein n=1 Tax=uncultured Imperialibacter sp. TaxID=1672639 RepID=UPI0030D7759E|tara:strand:- start:21290 stop:21706 length:417 start_codon:yes stop_codon:yes gene_type:complete
MTNPAPTIDSPETLRAAIIQLQDNQLSQRNELKTEFKLIYDSITPFNMIKGALKGVAQSTGISSLFSNHSSDHPSASPVDESPHHPIRRLIGSLVLLGVSGRLAKNSLLLKSLGRGLAHLLRSRQAKKLKALPEHIKG